jgi:hypothetical protein
MKAPDFDLLGVDGKRPRRHRVSSSPYTHFIIEPQLVMQRLWQTPSPDRCHLQTQP